MLAVVMGGCDEFQASVNAVGIPEVANGDLGHDSDDVVSWDECQGMSQLRLHPD